MEDQDSCSKTISSDRKAESMNTHHHSQLNNTWTTAFTCQYGWEKSHKVLPDIKSYKEWMTAERWNKSSFEIYLLINYPIPSGQPQNIEIWATINGLRRFNFYVYILHLHVAITNQEKETTNGEDMGTLWKIMQIKYSCEIIFKIR